MIEPENILSIYGGIMQKSVYTNKESRILYLYDDVDNNTVGNIISTILEIQAEDDEKDCVEKNYSRRPIKLYIQSYGGGLYDMWALVDLILESRTPIHTYSMGYCMSAGFKIFIAGHKRYIHKHSVLLYHQLSTVLWGKFKDVLDRTEQLKINQSDVENYVLSRTKVSKEKLDEVREKKIDWIITPEDAIRIGIADEII